MNATPTPIPGCLVLHPPVFTDARGRFSKPYHRQQFAGLSLETDFAEQFYSLSHRGVLRGLHFQLPPHDHAKLVYCVSGSVLDAVVDLRLGSPTFGQHAVIELSAARGNAVYIPAGLAHGFLVVSESAALVYNVTTPHEPEADAGIHWRSAGIPWPEREPLTSDRDARLPALGDFDSPFRYRT